MEPLSVFGKHKKGRAEAHEPFVCSFIKGRSNSAKGGKTAWKPVVLKVNAGKMQQDGFRFFLSKNGVWLTDKVPVSYLSF